jgi:hypothetical protein
MAPDDADADTIGICCEVRGGGGGLVPMAAMPCVGRRCGGGVVAAAVGWRVVVRGTTGVSTVGGFSWR